MTDLVMYKGLVRKLGDTYEILGSPDYPYDDWAVVKPFSIYCKDFDNIKEASSLNTANSNWNDKWDKESSNFPDCEHYGMQIVLGLESAILFQQVAPNNSTYLKRVGWSLNYYLKDINIHSALHTILYGDIEKVVIDKNRYSGNLVIKDGYRYFPFRKDEDDAGKKMGFVSLDTKGYSFDFETDDKGNMLSEVILHAY